MPDSDIILCIWSGDSQDLNLAKYAAGSIVKLLKETGIKKVLDDNRMGYGNWPDLMHWFKNEWISGLIDTNLRSYAHVLSPDLTAKIPAYELFNQTKEGVDFVTFDSFSAARTWLDRR